MKQDFTFKNSYTIEDLLEIISILRAPGGCPWDAKQTHESIKMNFIEETYETVEAINQNDSEMLKEELGDVLLQILLHTEMERESGNFVFDDVTDVLAKKLILRHPHVFSTAHAETPDEVIKNWDAIKRKSKGQKTSTNAMDSVPRELPALMRAQKVQSRAAKSGFDFDNTNDVFDKMLEEIHELQTATTEQEKQDELGDVLFTAVNLARFLGFDSEESLTDATDKFMRRFHLVEMKATESGNSLENMSFEELDKLWKWAKTKTN